MCEMHLSPEVIHILKILRLVSLFFIIVLGSRFFYYQRRIRKGIEKKVKIYTPPDDVTEQWKKGNLGPINEFNEKAKVIGEPYEKIVKESYERMDQSNNWLVWATMILALSDLIISIITSNE